MEIVVVMGYPASGKSTWAQSYVDRGYVRLNRDARGGSLEALLPEARAALAAGAKGIVLDNTYATAASRAPVIALGREAGVPVRCVWLATSIEDAQVNAVSRIVAKHGRLLTPDEVKSAAKSDPNVFPPAVLFRYRKEFEPPKESEGFAAVEKLAFERKHPTGYTQRALLLDYDGTLRRTRSGAKYPASPDDVEILPGRAEVLKKYQSEGYRLLGVSNQGDVARGKLSLADAAACFARTNELLGLEIEVAFCPHDPAPIGCYCRKPMPGIAVAFIEKYRLDRAQTIMVGDMTTDKTFAARAGVRYVDQSVFFG